MFAKSFYSFKVQKMNFDLDIMKRMITKIDVDIFPHKNGLFSPKYIDSGDLSGEMIKLINSYKKYDQNCPQFLMTHIIEPHRLLLRFLQKNIPKTEKITKYLLDNDIVKKLPEWMFDTKHMMMIINEFIKDLANKLVVEYTRGFNKLIDFVSGVNFTRIDIEYKNFDDAGKKTSAGRSSDFKSL